MSGDARDFNNIETRAAIKFFFSCVKAPKEIHAILTETLRGTCTVTPSASNFAFSGAANLRRTIISIPYASHVINPAEKLPFCLGLPILDSQCLL
jgi:hypothetical protein